MVPENPKYTDIKHIPVPQYKVGQRVFVLEPFIGRLHVAEKLIRAVNRPYWHNGFSTTSCWIVTYRYQDIIGGVPWGRMHTEYTLIEEDIYPTEELATIALAERFIRDTKRDAMEIASQFKKLGIPMNAAMLQLSAPKNQKQE